MKTHHHRGTQRSPHRQSGLAAGFPRRLFPALVLALAFAAPAILRAENPPGIISHSGRVAVNGTNFDGTGYFKFALVKGSGAPIWTHDGNFPQQNAVPVTVTKGLYTVPLGDTSFENMTKAIPASIFATYSEIYLRVWFSADDGATFEQLTPDRRILSTGYALSATQAQGVRAGGVTSGMIADGAVMADHLDFNAITADKIADGAVTTDKIADGAVTNTALAANSVKAGNLVDGAAGFYTGLERKSTVTYNVNGIGGVLRPLGIEISGNLAVIAGNGPTSPFVFSLTLLDVSDPANPVKLSEIFDGAGGFNLLEGASGLAISGNLLAVASQGDHSLTLIDITDPAAPVLLSEVADGTGAFTELSGAADVAIAGNVACVTSQNDSAVTIVNIANPAAPTVLATLKDGVNGFDNLAGAKSVQVAGDVLLVTSKTDADLNLIDIGNPAAPVLLAVVPDIAHSSDSRIGVGNLAVDGTTAYVTNYNGDALTVVDFSTPSAPVILASLSYPTVPPLDDASGVAVSGGKAFVSSFNRDSLSLFDVSDPANPVFLSEIPDDGHQDGAIFVAAGNGLVLLSGWWDNSVSIFQEADNNLFTGRSIGIGVAAPSAALDVAGTVKATTLEGALNGSFLTSGSVTGTQIAANSITGSHVQDGSLSGSDLAQNNTILAGHLATNSVGASEIAADAVGSSEIATSAVGSDEIANGSITSSDVNSSYYLPYRTTSFYNSPAVFSGPGYLNSSYSSYRGPLIVGSPTSYHIAMDDNEIQAYYSNSGYNTLWLNYWGGDVRIADGGGATYIANGGGAVAIGNGNGATTTFDVGTRDIWVDYSAGEPTIRPSSGNYGYLGTSSNYWYFSYVNNHRYQNQTTFSDSRTKRDIEPLDSCLEKLSQLDGKRYRLDPETHPFFKSLKGTTQEEEGRLQAEQLQLGFLAQNLQEVLPEMVQEDEETGYLTVRNYEQLFPVVVEGIKELRSEKDAELGALKAENAALKTRLEKLEAALEKIARP
ncbi:MAG: tail fiber domain-containing protein [Akkermansiaceae bacterium]|nr:tail fiber domain-containing protein [Akkermansiaceae bacterium]